MGSENEIVSRLSRRVLVKRGKGEMKNPFPESGPKRNLGFLVPPGISVSDIHDGDIVRKPGEFSIDPVLVEYQILELQLEKEASFIKRQLADLSDRTKMPITQENGQRRYGPPLDDDVTPPPRGSEVFVGKLPRNCYEPELVPVLEKAGRIYELRLMMNFSGNNRGYCFVQYFTPQEAEKAVRELNHFELRKGCRIGVVKSVDNCRLFIANIPKDKSEDEIKEEVDKLIEGVVRVIVRKPLTRKAENMDPAADKNRGYAFVEFESHRLAAMARRKLIPGKLKMWGQEIHVDWAEPEPDTQVLIVFNLSSLTTESTLHQIFNAASDGGVVRVEKDGFTNRAFISFLTHEQAEKAKNVVSNMVIDNHQVRVGWDKSMDQVQKKKGCKVRIDFNQKQNQNLIGGTLNWTAIPQNRKIEGHEPWMLNLPQLRGESFISQPITIPWNNNGYRTLEPHFTDLSIDCQRPIHYAAANTSFFGSSNLVSTGATPSLNNTTPEMYVPSNQFTRPTGPEPFCFFSPLPQHSPSVSYSSRSSGSESSLSPTRTAFGFECAPMNGINGHAGFGTANTRYMPCY